ncbi:hypothetical protein [Amycolatopsis sp. DG1A-15b]|uniref:hypothetical protein n=1 Tax=Amycolatopsis sp. DG1A-15b TaxID=3052846 RepID=UPI00255B5C36|nr:hypothetical protein [Amycolatopsis sp. DG1A-15b]WIX90406.1 hypothetical protein QRY02_08240 [Amycolatopsis sp. DG1A-15b]
MRHELLVEAVQAGLGLRVLSVLHAGHHVGHQVHFHDRELHRSFTVSLQSMIAYWVGRYEDSVKYAEQGTKSAGRSQKTSAVLIASGQACPLAATTATWCQ